MRSNFGRAHRLSAALALACALSAAYAQQPLTWTTIVNNGDTVPGTTLNFNSYNQPAINNNGLVVFRARGRTFMEGGEALALAPDAHMTTSGVFLRDMGALGPVTILVKRDDQVPPPNNTLYLGALAAFTEFPSSARIDINSALAVTRGQHNPVYSYFLPDTTETRVGANGVYANMGAGLLTAASLLGAVSEKQPDDTWALSFPHFSVPDAPAGTRFDVFPGAPMGVDGTKVAFKGNFTDLATGIGHTGVYYRDLAAESGMAPVTVIASSYSTLIPNQPAGGTVKFGATAGPSGANGYLVFTGWDIEEAPTIAGIYRAPIGPNPPLQVLASFGQQVPGEPEGSTFSQFGEGLSISEDGRYVSFWATWGAETTPKTLYCVTDGNQDLLDYCNAAYPDGYPVGIPVHQGIFVADAQTGHIIPVVKTGQDGIEDLLFWVFSGRPPGVGGGEEGEEQELPRWRSSGFAALSGKPGQFYGTPGAGSRFQVALKAARNGVVGIYLRKGGQSAPLETVVETMTWQGQAIDPQAPAGSIVSAVGIERDGFRHDNLAITVSMLFETVEESVGWAGLYLAKVSPLQPGELAASPTSLAFGNVAIDTASAPQDVVVTNTGDFPATVSSVTLVSPHFAIAGNTCPAELSAGASCTVTVTFSPVLVGLQSASLGINGSLSVALGGTGIFGESVLANVNSVITGYYGTLFGRAPDAQGLAYWLSEYARMSALGADTKEVFYALGRSMLNSPEYLARNTSDSQFIADLYASFLMRAPDAGGMAYWLGQLASGLDRRVLTSAFIFSPEYTGYMAGMFGAAQAPRPEFSAVTDMYRGFLNRLPDSEGFAFWLAEWQTAQCAGPAAVADAAERMSVQFFTSAEFAAHYAAEPQATRLRMIVASFYDTFLRRGADAQGFNYWVAQLEGGTSVDEVRRAFIASPEFQGRINVICAAGCIVKP